MSAIARALRPARRGQAGITVIELLITVALASLVLIPLFGLVNQVLRQRQPVEESAAASKQLSIFRTTLAADWASAKAIVLNPSYPENEVYCNGPGFNQGPIRIAMLNSVKKTAQVNGVDVTYDERILYQERDNGDGSVSIYRLVCRHNLGKHPDDLREAWRTGERADEVNTIAPGVPSQNPPIPIGRTWRMLDRVRAVVFPSPHTCRTVTHAPFPKCDVNMTIVGIDEKYPYQPFNPSSPYATTAQRATLRLFQQRPGMDRYWNEVPSCSTTNPDCFIERLGGPPS